jgi:DNA-binding transcriptional MerR regulator
VRIGELATRLRVSTRTLRYYESLGLLRPQHVDEVNGYRDYGHDALLRGMRIEQLKAAGLGLSAIRDVLDGAVPLQTALERRRRAVNGMIDEHQRQLSVIESLARAPGELAAVELVRAPAVEVVVRTARTSPDTLTATIRRQIQRLRRQLKAAQPDGSWTFLARFPLDLDPDEIEGEIEIDVEIEVEIAALLTAPLAGACTWPATMRLETTLIGPRALLPLAYDALLGAVVLRRLVTTGVVCETYHDLAPISTTTVSLVIEPSVDPPSR